MSIEPSRTAVSSFSQRCCCSSTNATGKIETPPRKKGVWIQQSCCVSARVVDKPSSLVVPNRLLQTNFQSHTFDECEFALWNKVNKHSPACLVSLRLVTSWFHNCHLPTSSWAASIIGNINTKTHQKGRASRSTTQLRRFYPLP